MNSLLSKKRRKYRQALIHLVREREYLWNHWHQEFPDRKKKDWTWEQIAKKLGDHPNAVRRCWDNLRDQYRRDLKREMLRGIKSKWDFYSDMDFIRPMIKIRVNDTEQQEDSIIETQVVNAIPFTEANLPPNQSEVSVKVTQAENVAASTERNFADTHSDLRVENPDHFNFQPIKISTEWKQQSDDYHNKTFPEPDIEQNMNDSFSEMSQVEICKAELIEDFNTDEDEGASVLKSNSAYNHLERSSAQPYRMKSEKELKQKCHPCSSTSMDQSQDMPIHDDHYYFLMSLLPSLREVPKKRILPLRSEIINLISRDLSIDS